MVQCVKESGGGVAAVAWITAMVEVQSLAPELLHVTSAAKKKKDIPPSVLLSYMHI